MISKEYDDNQRLQSNLETFEVNNKELYVSILRKLNVYSAMTKDAKYDDWYSNQNFELTLLTNGRKLEYSHIDKVTMKCTKTILIFREICATLDQR